MFKRIWPLASKGEKSSIFECFQYTSATAARDVKVAHCVYSLNKAVKGIVGLSSTISAIERGVN